MNPPAGGGAFPSFPGGSDTPSDIDDRSYASGPSPAAVTDLPTPTLFSDAELAIGSGWIADHGTLSGWSLMQIADIQSIAVVPPSVVRRWALSRSPVSPRPSVAMRDRQGQVIAINVAKFPSDASRVLLPQLPAGAVVTAAASMFLSTGGLPGKWNKTMRLGF
jgi:hypothetical protein